MKIIKIIISIVCVLLTCAVVVFAGMKIIPDLFGDDDDPGVYTYQSNGKIYTQNNWVWQPAKIRKTPIYDSELIVDTTDVHLHLNNNDYFVMNVPSQYEYYWDYGKCVYARNGEYAIRIVGDATANSLSQLAGIKNVVNITPSIITNEPEKRAYRSIAMLLGDTGYAVICEVYSGNDVYSCLLDSLMNNSIESVITDTDAVSTLDELPIYFGDYCSRITYSEISLATKKYMFAEGDLYIKADARSLNTIRNEYITLLTLMSGSKDISQFTGDGISYVECGNAYLGMIAYNSNTTIIAIGEGDESKCNILDLLWSLK